MCFLICATLWCKSFSTTSLFLPASTPQLGWFLPNSSIWRARAHALAAWWPCLKNLLLSDCTSQNPITRLSWWPRDSGACHPTHHQKSNFSKLWVYFLWHSKLFVCMVMPSIDQVISLQDRSPHALNRSLWGKSFYPLHRKSSLHRDGGHRMCGGFPLKMKVLCSDFSPLILA